MVFDKIRYSRDTKLSIGLVLVGVGVCTVTDVSVNTKGFVAAFVAVWSTSLQQYVSVPEAFLLLQSNILVNSKLRLKWFIHDAVCTLPSAEVLA